MSESIDRRAMLGMMGVGAAVTAGMTAGAAARPRMRTVGDDLGWDASTGEYVLPPLPYPADALEPFIDETTMTIHHDKHHAGYVRGLNTAIRKLAEIRNGQGDPSLVAHWTQQVSFHGSGHVNHARFWRMMAPPERGGGGQPGGTLAKAIEADFGSFERFVAQFKLASAKVEGSGWGWLVLEPVANRLLVLQGEKQQDTTVWGVTPILGIDVWEHAYYLKYQNDRAAYIDAFFNVINWPHVESLYEAAAAGGAS